MTIYEETCDINFSPSLLEKHTDGSGSRPFGLFFYFIFPAFLAPVLSFSASFLSIPRLRGGYPRSCPLRGRPGLHLVEEHHGLRRFDYYEVESPFEDDQMAMVRINHTGWGRGPGVGTGVHGPMYIMVSSRPHV